MIKKYFPRIGILTDDLTGGGDIGVQFADKGLKVKLSIDIDAIKDIPSGTEVWIINTNSRSDSPVKAAKKVTKAAEYLKSWNADYFYKKVDSTLRGPIGAELQALIDSLDIESLPFCAAYPDMGRVTIDSIHYVHGQKITDSSYGSDINAPVTESNIKILLEKQMETPQKVDVKDAANNNGLVSICKERKGKVFAGAAAWAGYLLDEWITTPRKVQNVVFSPGPVMLVSGSLNPVSLRQKKYWEETGKFIMDLNSEKKYPDDDLLVTTVEKETASSIKKLMKIALSLWSTGKWDRVILNGGDTAYRFMKGLGDNELEIIKSVSPGIALAKHMNNFVILKPGGYGEDDMFIKLVRLLGGK